MAFLIFPVALLILAIVEQRGLFKVSVIVTALYFGCTWGYGYDWINYRDTYDMLHNPTYGYFFAEPGLYWLMLAGSYLGLSYGIFSFFVTMFIYYAVYKFCDRLNNPSAAFFTVFAFLGYFVFTEWVRQGLAISIIMLSIKHHEKDHYVRFVLSVAVACLFHASAVVALSYLLISSKSRLRMKMFLIIASAVMFSAMLIIYNPSVTANLPFIGAKVTAYSSLLLENNDGFWKYILSSKVVFAYLIILVMLYSQARKYNSLFSAISAIYFMLLTRFVSVLIRVGYILVPVFVVSMDEYLTDKGRGFHTRLPKLAYLALIFGVSTIPVWNAVFWEAARSNVNIVSDKSEIESEIANKCNIINKYYDYNVIERCR
ncbi:TPA: EpsG family protein [Enterobacter soli]